MVGGNKGFPYIPNRHLKSKSSLDLSLLFFFTQKSSELNEGDYFYFIILIKMEHLFKNEKDVVCIHTIYGHLFKSNEPMKVILDLLKQGQGIRHKMKDVNGETFTINAEYVDLVFNSKEIWHNNYNEEFFNQIKQTKC